jgi:integrase
MTTEQQICPPQSPFVNPDGMMMSEVLLKLDTVAVTDVQRRDLKSAIKSVCRLVGRRPEEVPANINWVHVRLRRVHPVKAGISEKRLKNIRSGVLKALALCGASKERSDWLRPPSPEWAALLEIIPDKHDRWKLSQLAQFCTAGDIAPNQVADHHVKNLLDALKTETFADRPTSKVGAAVSVWNRLGATLQGWPQQSLTFPRAKKPWTIPLDQFPSSFVRDVDAWLDRLANPDPISGEGPIRPVRASTIKHRRFQIQEMASALVRTGHPITSIKGLAYVVDVEHFKSGLRYMMDRFGGKPTEAIHGLAVGVTAIAEHHVKVDTDQLKQLKQITRRLNLEVDGLRAKNQERLAQLDDEENLARLLHLPERLQIKAHKPGIREHRRALMIQVALAIEILLHAPMRIGNLCSLHLEHHIRKAQVKGKACLVLAIPGHEVKNGKDLSFELSGETIRLFELYLREHRPVLLREPSDYLFPAQNGSHKRTSALSNLIKQTIYDQTGLVIHAHLFRSIAGKIHSMVHPGDFLTLGHAIGDSLKTAMKSYAQFEQQNAVRHYQSSVEEARQRTRSKGHD